MSGANPEIITDPVKISYDEIRIETVGGNPVSNKLPTPAVTCWFTPKDALKPLITSDPVPGVTD